MSRDSEQNRLLTFGAVDDILKILCTEYAKPRTNDLEIHLTVQKQRVRGLDQTVTRRYPVSKVC